MFHAMNIAHLLTLTVLSRVVTSQQQQQPLTKQLSSNDKKDILYELQKAEIIPTVINTFTPLVTVNITWPNATADLGNTLSPSLLQSSPDLYVYPINSSCSSSSSSSDSLASSGTPLVLALTDPDAPSRDNPEWSEICHWIVATSGGASSSSLHSSNGSAIASDNTRSGPTEIMPYKPPGPPPKTGKHRYVFLLLAAVNRTTEPLHLSKPGDRQHWGYEGERQGVRMWAEENGLEVVGANFVYAQNKDQ